MLVSLYKNGMVIPLEPIPTKLTVLPPGVTSSSDRRYKRITISFISPLNTFIAHQDPEQNRHVEIKSSQSGNIEDRNHQMVLLGHTKAIAANNAPYKRYPAKK